MRRAEGTFAGAGGVPIFWEQVTPASGRPRGVVVVSHGYAEHLGRYQHLVAHLAARGVASIALDHRGHGRSGGPRGHCGSFAEMVADLRTLADVAEASWPGVPRVLFGHSMGGLIAFLYLVQHGDTVRAGALSGPAFRLAATVPRGQRMAAAALARVLPRVGFTSALDAGALSRDPAVGAAYLADPLVHRRASAGFFRAFLAAQAEAERDAGRVRVPLLILQGGADRLVDPSGAGAIGKRLTAANEVVLLPGYFHELLNEPEAERAQVLTLLDAWFDRWLGD